MFRLRRDAGDRTDSAFTVRNSVVDAGFVARPGRFTFIDSRQATGAANIVVEADGPPNSPESRTIGGCWKANKPVHLITKATF